MPLPKEGFSAVRNGEHIVIFGGKDERGKLLRSTHVVVDNEIRELECKGKVPSARWYHTAHMWRGNMIVLLGHHTIVSDRDDGGKSISVLDTSTNIWSTVTCTGTVPPHLVHHGSVLIGNKLFVSGGFQYFSVDAEHSSSTSDSSENDSTSSKMYCLDLTTNCWSIITKKLPEDYTVWGHTMTPYGDKIFCYGGVKPTGFASSAICVYNITTDSWEVTDSRIQKAMFSYSPAGKTKDQQMELKEGNLVRTIFKDPNGNWNKGLVSDTQSAFYPAKFVAPFPQPRFLHQAASTIKGLFIAGGRDKTLPLKTDDEPKAQEDCWLLDYNSYKWTEIELPPNAKSSLVMSKGVPQVSSIIGDNITVVLPWKRLRYSYNAVGDMSNPTVTELNHTSAPKSVDDEWDPTPEVVHTNTNLSTDRRTGPGPGGGGGGGPGGGRETRRESDDHSKSRSSSKKTKKGKNIVVYVIANKNESSPTASKNIPSPGYERHLSSSSSDDITRGERVTMPPSVRSDSVVGYQQSPRAGYYQSPGRYYRAGEEVLQPAHLAPCPGTSTSPPRSRLHRINEGSRSPHCSHSPSTEVYQSPSSPKGFYPNSAPSVRIDQSGLPQIQQSRERQLRVTNLSPAPPERPSHVPPGGVYN